MHLRSLGARLICLSTLSMLACSTAPAGDEGFSTFTTNPTTFGDGDGDTGESSSAEGDGDGDPGDGDGDSDTVCGDMVVEGDEQCDLGPANSDTGQCTTNCRIAACGDGFVYGNFEECDDGNPDNTDACVMDCKAASCGDGYTQAGVEMCDDGNTDDADGCNTMCMPGSCGDGIVQAGEQCDDGNGDTTDACPACDLAFCGDGFPQAGVEACDDGNMSSVDACTYPFCELNVCGDGIVYDGMEECDDGNDVDGDDCTIGCTSAVCGDGIVQVGMEECDDGNDDDSDACDNACEFGPIACQGGSVQLSISPGGNMIVCDDPNNQTCEENLETLCPPSWGLCSYQQFINRNAGWNYASQAVVVGEIYCRNGGGAGHYTLGVANLGNDIGFNCSHGSSRPNSCPAGYGCNELGDQALCCAPTGTCGNGQVEGPEETCDDGNQNETDACLNSCTLRSPGC
jgi:cysteine-rich repeat protein